MPQTSWKVLNEGLGFHPKAESLDRTPEDLPLDQKLDKLIQVVEAAPIVPRRLSEQPPALPPELPVIKPAPAPTAPRPKTPPTAKVDKKLFQPVAKKGLDFTEPKKQPTPPKIPAFKPPVFKKVCFSLRAFVVDVFVVASINLLLLSALIFISQVDLVSLLVAQNNTSAQLAAAVSVLVVLKIYILLTRSFCGFTLGEWTWALQVGRAEQIKKSWYPLLVLWRSVLVFATGFVLFPVLSILTRRDVLYYLTGLQLYQKN